MSTNLTEAKQRLLHHLKRTGPTTASTLAEILGLTEVAVRQHLQSLLAQGWVRATPQPPRGRGRPSTHWSLTEVSRPLFPDRHGELTAELLEGVQATFGAEGMERLLSTRTRHQLTSYRAQVPAHADASLETRLHALARLRTEEGYMAEVETDPQAPTTYHLVEHHCPICDAARQCQGLCAQELALFRELLGPAVEVTRTEHLLADGQRCRYRIRPRAETVDDEPGTRRQGR